MQQKSMNLTPAKNAGLSYSVLIILHIAISFLGGFVLGMVDIKEYSTTYYAISMLFPLLSLLVVFLIFAKGSGEDIITSSGIKKCSPIYILIAVFISVGMFLGFGFLNEKFAELLVDIGAVLPEHSVSEAINSTGSFILFFFLIGILPAIFEEIFFRGLLTQGLKNTGRVFTVIMVALSFALYHASAVQFVYQLIYGAVLTLLAIKSKSVIPSMVAHFINNGLILVLTYFFDMTETVSSPLLIALGMVLVIASVLFLCLYKKDKKPSLVKGERKSFGVFAIAGLIVALVIAITGVIPA